MVGALALQAYGYHDRLTRDMDAEVVGSIEALTEFLNRHGIPADLTANFSGWSVVAMPPGYRDRATDLVHQSNIRVRLLSPIDFVISKLRRGTDLDLQDATFVVSRFHLTPTRCARQLLPHSLLLPRTPPCFCFERRWTSSAKALVLKTINSPMVL